ncbi:helix-turn-helix domain-containing protein [Arthrobacter woluwensis]|jgi:DNA-binding XRE family transcriptional regulator|uniref:helix-turn-helix domain-containing protein n=1 Tax=Arthrobacter woluwensis TaxID=156980 RepID=UPI00381E3681
MAENPFPGQRSEAPDVVAHLSPVSPLRREPLWRHLLGGSLRRRRTERGETLETVAARAGVSTQYLSEIERGRKEPSSEIIAVVARALDVTLVDLTLDVAQALTVERPVVEQSTASATCFALAA